MERTISIYSRVITLVFIFSFLLNIWFSLNSKKEFEFESKIESLNQELETKDNIILFYRKRYDLSVDYLKKEVNYKPEITIKEKYEKITDTIYANPFKRDSITYYRLLYYIQNRDRFSAKGFNVVE